MLGLWVTLNSLRLWVEGSCLGFRIESFRGWVTGFGFRAYKTDFKSAFQGIASDDYQGPVSGIARFLNSVITVDGGSPVPPYIPHT